MKIPDIYGFNTSSEAGQNEFAASIFLLGCNLRCPYCMNKKLVSQSYWNTDDDLKAIPWDTIKEKIKDGNFKEIMISGGEPTAQNPRELLNLVLELNKLGCKVGMSTNGTFPDVLKDVISHLFYVAMDYKGDLKDKIYGPEGVLSVVRSKCILMSEKYERDDFDYELRTTLCPKHVDKAVLNTIGKGLCGNERWVLQQYRQTSNMLNPEELEDVVPYTEEEIDDLMKVVKKYTNNAHTRYV